MTPEDFKGRAKRLDDLDLPRVGRMIGVGEDEIHAILEVESRGSGFDGQGRPTLLFEPHIFWRELGAGKKRDAAARAGLAYPKWGAKGYPKDSYPRLKQAMAIDETAALRSASYGLAQVMGFNHKAAGYDTVQAMVLAFCASEAAQLEAMISFIKASRLDDEIRRHDWAGFARGYNGAGFAKNSYDKRLAKSFAKWQKIKDTPFDLSMAAAEDAANAPEETSFVDKARVKAVQQKLIDLGYHMVGKPDGAEGPRTAGAITAFQVENDLPITGKISDDLIAQLEAADPHEPSVERQAGEPENSRIVAGASKLKTIAATVAGGIGIDSIPDALDKAETAQGIAGRLRDLIAPIKGLLFDNLKIVAAVIAIGVIVYAIEIRRARVQDFQTGKTP